MQNFFLIHGFYGNPYKNWLPYLKSQLGKRKLNCVVPNFPSPYKQDYESWSKILNSYLEIGYITENTTFITHSLRNFCSPIFDSKLCKSKETYHSCWI